MKYKLGSIVNDHSDFLESDVIFEFTTTDSTSTELLYNKHPEKSYIIITKNSLVDILYTRLKRHAVCYTANTPKFQPGKITIYNIDLSVFLGKSRPEKSLFIDSGDLFNSETDIQQLLVQGRLLFGTTRALCLTTPGTQSNSEMLKILYNSSGAKLIQQDNTQLLCGEVVPHGNCNKNSLQCRPADPIKPCCKSILRNMLNNILPIINEAGLHYWADYGTLLALVREKDFIIPHDDDVDLGITKDEENKFLTLRPQFEHLGYMIQRDPVEESLWRIFYSKSNLLHIDFYVWHPDRDNLTRTYYHAEDACKGKVFPKKWISERTLLNGFYVPKDTMRMVIFRYGNSWNIPLKRQEGYVG